MLNPNEYGHFNQPQGTIHQFIVFLSQAWDRPNTSTTIIVEVFGLSHARDKESDEMNNYYEFYFNT